jgi:hypothetical protein
MNNNSIIRKILYISPRLIILTLLGSFIFFAMLANFNYIERYLFPLHLMQGEVQAISENILIGPYQDFDELKKLRNETGINVVISLLNSDLPQERALLKREVVAAGRLGITVYNYPITHFDLKGEGNRKIALNLVAMIKELQNRKIYIHCYLGRHRVNFIKHELVKRGLAGRASI